MTEGGVHYGQQLDPVRLLVVRLAEHYAPFGEERRINAMNELAAFRRQPFESTDAMVARFCSRVTDASKLEDYEFNGKDMHGCC